MVKKYEKLPIRIEAIRYDGESNIVEVLEFIGKNGGRKEYLNEKILVVKNERLTDTIIRQGEYVVKNVFGDFTVVNAKVFKALYAEIKDETPQPDENPKKKK